MDRFISLSYCLRVTVIVLLITQSTSKVISGRNAIITITQIKVRLSVHDISMSFCARQCGLVKIDVQTRQTFSHICEKTFAGRVFLFKKEEDVKTVQQPNSSITQQAPTSFIRNGGLGS